MATPDIPQVLSALYEYWSLHPQQRLGQLLNNLSRDPVTTEPNIEDIEDGELLNRIKSRLGRVRHSANEVLTTEH